MIGTILAWLAANVLPNVLKNLFSVGQSEVDQAKARADQIALGQAQQKTVDTETALAAQKRIDAAGAEPVETGKRLSDGTF